jgi:hypothetical protein
MKFNPGIGATSKLNLRVSVATLVRVIFKHPVNAERMLALERKAILRETKKGHIVRVKSQPFGGAIRILDLNAIHDLIGDFHFDSKRSRSEQDFRLFIRPSSWPAIREFCIQHLRQAVDPILETDPERELTEEFDDALNIHLKPEQYISKAVATVVEDAAATTENIQARGIPTVRVYSIFEALIPDPALAHTILTNHNSLSHKALRELALEDARNGGKGRANAVLAVPLKRISNAYLARSPNERNTPIWFEDNRLNETVPAMLEGISVPKYQKV